MVFEFELLFEKSRQDDGADSTLFKAPDVFERIAQGRSGRDDGRAERKTM